MGGTRSSSVTQTLVFEAVRSGPGQARCAICICDLRSLQKECGQIRHGHIVPKHPKTMGQWDRFLEWVSSVRPIRERPSDGSVRRRQPNPGDGWASRWLPRHCEIGEIVQFLQNEGDRNKNRGHGWNRLAIQRDRRGPVGLRCREGQNAAKFHRSQQPSSADSPPRLGFTAQSHKTDMDGGLKVTTPALLAVCLNFCGKFLQLLWKVPLRHGLLQYATVQQLQEAESWKALLRGQELEGSDSSEAVWQSLAECRGFSN